MKVSFGVWLHSLQICYSFPMPLLPFAFRKATLTMQQKFLAIIVGYLTAVVLVVVSFGALAVVAPEIMPNLNAGEKPGMALLIVSLLISFYSAIIAGYMTAHIAQSVEKQLAVVLGIVMMVIGVLTMVMEGGVKPLWWHVVMLLSLVPCTVWGSSLYNPKGRK